jgi:uncharacterized protein (DUF58 family)
LAIRASKQSREKRSAPNDDRSLLFDAEFLKKLEYLHMVSRKTFTGTNRADRRMRKIGSGIEFADHRKYSRGDDFRYIDWNVYGRIDKLLLRLFEEEEDLHIYILLDASKSMLIGDPLKLHYGMQMAAALTYVGLANLDRVGIVPFSDKLHEHLPVARGKQRIFTVFDFLRSIQAGGPTKLEKVTEKFIHRYKRKGLVVLISDFYDPAGFEEGINSLRYNGFEPFVLQIYDQKEINPLFHGDLTLVDCETGAAKEITVTKALIEAYVREHEKYCNELSTYASSKGIPYFRTHTKIPFDELVLKIFRLGGFLK